MLCAKVLKIDDQIQKLVMLFVKEGPTMKKFQVQVANLFICATWDFSIVGLWGYRPQVLGLWFGLVF
jgi:hypothetical protein